MTEYEIINARPPNWLDILAHFPDVDEERVIVTYGNKIYTDKILSLDLIAHELTHVRQQSIIGPGKWWEQYFALVEFRYGQELEAYKNQADDYKTRNKDRNKVDKFMRVLALHLSGPMYGHAAQFRRAYTDIKRPGQKQPMVMSDFIIGTND